jgi:hypothetical protein
MSSAAQLEQRVQMLRLLLAAAELQYAQGCHVGFEL